MTEAEWLACTDPQKMLEFLRSKASEWKLWLLAVACCRRVWHLLSDERSRKAVEVVSKYAEGMADVEILNATQAVAHDAWVDTDENTIEEYATALVVGVVGSDACEAAASATKAADVAAHVAIYGFDTDAPASSEELEAAYQSLRAAEQVMQNRLLHCIFGNHFRPATVDPSWLSWNDGTVPKLAHAIYDERAFDRMLTLADALEEAGCGDHDILSHCRQPGEHVRGCWVVDLILCKE